MLLLLLRLPGFLLLFFSSLHELELCCYRSTNYLNMSRLTDICTKRHTDRTTYLVSCHLCVWLWIIYWQSKLLTTTFAHTHTGWLVWLDQLCADVAPVGARTCSFFFFGVSRSCAIDHLNSTLFCFYQFNLLVSSTTVYSIFLSFFTSPQIHFTVTRHKWKWISSSGF